MMTQNYSKLNSRDKRLYSINDLAISKTGIATKFLLIAFVLTSISLVIHSSIAMAIGNWYFSPIQGDEIDVMPLLFVVGAPIGIAAILYFMKISNYRLIDFLIIYFKPKTTVSFNGEKTFLTEVKVDAFMENYEVIGN